MMNEQSLKSLIKKIYTKKKQSVWTVTLGKKQSGKTDFTLRIMELLHELDLADGFGSNVKSIKAPFEIDFIEDFQTLKARCQMLNPDAEKHGIKRYFFFASEMGKWLPRDQPWRNTKFIEELQTVRKIGLNWLGDGVNRIDERVVNEMHFDGKFRKVSIMRPDIATYHNYSNGRTETIQGIKRTTLKFNTWESCNFYMEPQVPEDIVVPLNPEHKIVQEYLKHGSWKKAGIHPQEGKNSVKKVLEFHMTHCLHTIKEPVELEALPAPLEES